MHPPRKSRGFLALSGKRTLEDIRLSRGKIERLVVARALAHSDMKGPVMRVLEPDPSELLPESDPDSFDIPPHTGGRFSVLRRSLRHSSPTALPEPFYVLGGVVVPMQTRATVLIGALMPPDGQALPHQAPTSGALLAGIGRRHGYN
jgi:hypothetical protein